MDTSKPILPFPGRLLHRKTLKGGMVVEVRLRHTLWPTIPSYWQDVNAICKEVGQGLGLPEFMDPPRHSGIDVFDIEARCRRLQIEAMGLPPHLVTNGKES